MARVHFLPVWMLTTVGASVLFVGCGDSGTPTEAIKVETYLKTYDTALCSYLVRCGQAPDVKTCDDVFGPDKDVAQAVASVVFGTLQFDPAAAQTCIDTFGKTDCQTVYGYPFHKELADACNAVFVNRAKVGDGCFVGLECESGFCDAATGCGNACCVGKCSAVSTAVPDGGDCTMAACVPEDYCDKSTAKPTCKPHVGANDTCPQVDSCEAGFLCDTASKKCFKAAASKAQCNPDLSVNPCLEQNEYCNKNTKVCTRLPTVGESCMDAGICSRDSVCTESAGTTCVAAPVAGEPCPSGSCMGALKCDTMGTMNCLPLNPVHTCVPETGPVSTTSSSSASTGTGGG